MKLNGGEGITGQSSKTVGSPENEMSKLVVAIINWNTLDLTRDCLRSLFEEMDGFDCEVWVVDNNSSDGSPEMIKREFPHVKLIENTENVGFARANNQVLREAKGEYFLLLNSDTIVPPGSIRGLCQFMDDYPDAAAVGPKLRNAEGIPERPLKPLPTLLGELRYCLVNHFFPFGKAIQSLFQRGEDAPPIKPTRAEVLSAACLIIRREVTEKVGILSEDYFLFSEENDLFYRMRVKRLYGYYIPEIEVIHFVGKSRLKKGSIDSEINFLKSRMLYFKKFHGRDILLFKTIYYFFFMWSYLMALFKRFLGRQSDYPVLYRELLKNLSRGV